MNKQLNLIEPAGGDQPVVSARDGKVFANSRDVAASFGKNHRDVMRSIDNLIEQEPSLGVRNFAQGLYRLPETRDQEHRCFDMDRDGFTLLAMGFTGKKALKWKLRYIEAFNQMEAQLRGQQGLVLSPEIVEMIERTFGISRMSVRKVTELEKMVMLMNQRISNEEARVDERARALLAESALLLRKGKTAKQIWDAAGLPPKIKGSSNWFGHRLTEGGCLLEGRADRGDGSIRLFDPDKAEALLRLGLKATARQYADEHRGQGRLKLVS